MRFLTVLLLTLLAPATAGAAVFHVDASVPVSAADCTVGSCKTIADALTQARAPAHAGPDTIQVGAGTYTESPTLINADDSGDVLEGYRATPVVNGTLLVGNSTNPSQDAITVRAIKLVVPSSKPADTTGVIVNATNAVLDHVTVEMHAPGSGAAVWLSGADPLLDHVVTKAAGAWAGPGVRTDGRQLTVAIRDSDLAGGAGKPAITLAVAQMEPGPGAIHIERSIVRAGASAYAAASLGDFTGVVDSSLFLGGSQEALYVSGANKPADVTLRNVTIDAGAPLVADAGVHGVFAGQSQATVKLRSSISLEDLATAVPSTTIACTDSDVGPQATPTIDCPAANGNALHTPSQLFGAGYELKPGSPAVDTGAGDLAAGESATDLAGLARVADGSCAGVAARDRGAYELAPLPCPAPPPADPGAPGAIPPPPPGADTAPPHLALTLKRRQHGRRLRLRARLDEAGTIAVKVRWGKHVRRVRARTVVAGRTLRITLRLPRGAHRLRITVTGRDVAGNAAVRRRAVRLLT